MSRTTQTIIKDYFGHADRRNSTRANPVIGVEFENELPVPVPWPVIDNWIKHDEGSLRVNGCEYALDYPIPLDKVIVKIQHLFKQLVKYHLTDQMSNSSRTSTHVHFDMSHYSYWDMCNFAIGYWLFEELLMPFIGDHRKGNHFCLGLSQTKFIPNFLALEISQDNPFTCQAFYPENRYSSVNFNAVSKFCSLEFRAFRGVSEAESAVTWIECLEAIRIFTLKFGTPKALLKYLEDQNSCDLPKIVFGDKLYKSLFLNKFSSREITEAIHRAIADCMPIFMAYNVHVKKFPDKPQAVNPYLKGYKAREGFLNLNEELVAQLRAAPPVRLGIIDEALEEERF